MRWRLRKVHPLSSPQAIDAEKIARATEIALASASAEKADGALADATAKDKAAVEAKDGVIDMTDAVAQAGRQLARGIVERRLRELNPNLYFQRSINDPEKNGIYLAAPNGEGRFLCGMEWNPSPEFTVNFTGEHDGRVTVLRQVRGWRAVLARLIKLGVIEPERATTLFAVRQGRESANWYHFYA
jgi:hypothetical protein